MPPPKRGRLNIHINRRDAEHAEDLFYFFCFPLRGRKAKISNPEGLSIATAFKMPPYVA